MEKQVESTDLTTRVTSMEGTLTSINVTLGDFKFVMMGILNFMKTSSVWKPQIEEELKLMRCEILKFQETSAIAPSAPATSLPPLPSSSLIKPSTRSHVKHEQPPLLSAADGVNPSSVPPKTTTYASSGDGVLDQFGHIDD
ncbi:hypothetical protein PR202_ga12949 [Eleusine coracana subsp. coracana]|uniref:Uncharacterized protein n=1 Tax=Eleusine coracana subsp. coracana TaxID=191504 RepID=A0AAV5CDK1_ELECO|nr:hypothetical protein PR202_ga12949 [Eleusine coracana subsp. coracana]